jgi:hypothetical protein
MARLVAAMLVSAVLVAGCGGASGREPVTSPAQPPAGLASAAAAVEEIEAHDTPGAQSAGDRVRSQP